MVARKQLLLKNRIVIVSLMLGLATMQVKSEITGGIKIDGNLSNFFLI